jgi:hypothetical protein
MRTARTVEAEWWQVLRGREQTGAKEEESSTGRVWAAGFHQCVWAAGFHQRVWAAGFHQRVWAAGFHQRVWAAGFHHVTARSHLTGVLKLTNRLFL